MPLVIGICVSVPLLFGLVLVVIMYVNSSGGASGPGKRLVGVWELDLADVVRSQGLEGELVDEAVKEMRRQGAGMQFHFRSNGRMSMNSKMPEEAAEAVSGSWSVKNVRGNSMDIVFDVKGQSFDEKITITFLDNNRFRGDFGGVMMSFIRR